MTDSLPEPGRPWFLYFWVGLVVSIIAIAFFFSGEVQGPQQTNPQEQGPAVVDSQKRCQLELDAVLKGAEPVSLEISSKPEERARDLNLWWQDCSSLLIREKLFLDDPQADPLISEELKTRIVSSTFTSHDVKHIRNALLLHRLASKLTQGTEDSLARVVQLFDYVNRSMLDFPTGETPEMSLFEAILIGRGSGAHRAWFFGELLRQLRYDAVILFPSGEENGPWLVGVPLTQNDVTQVYLFDTHAGLPIPAASERDATSPLVRTPATLAQVREDDSLFRALDLPDHPYPFTSEQMQQLRVGMIGNSSIWSTRIAALSLIATTRGALLFDGLGKNALQAHSQLDRLMTAGNGGAWSADDLFVWSFPEQQRFAPEVIDSQSAQVVSILREAMQGPDIRTNNESPEGANVVTTRRTTRYVRSLQLSGNWSEAIREYGDLKYISSFQLQLPKNQICLDMIVYWMAKCQFELGEYESVKNTASQYPPNGMTHWPPQWIDAILKLGAFSRALVDDYVMATQLLSADPILQTHGTQYLIRRWTRLAQAQQAKTPDADNGSKDDTSGGKEP